MIKIIGNIVKIDTINTTMILRATKGGYVENIYYGKAISDNYNIEALAVHQGTGQGTAVCRQFGNDKLWLDNCCLEHSSVGRGDYREAMLTVDFGDNNTVYECLYQDMCLVDDFVVPQLPNSHGKSQTLKISLVDSAKNLNVDMYYSVFDDCDVIVKSMAITNNSDKVMLLNRVMSSQLDLPCANYTLDTLDGAWSRERYINSTRLKSGIITIDSKRGISSNTHNPYIVLRQDNCTLDNGNCIGINLVYSGNHQEIIETTPLGKVRVLNGICQHNFTWHLNSKETFFTPESTVCYSPNGSNGLSQQYHHFVNHHIVRGNWANKPRPVLINNWEATYFNFTEKKLLALAKQAKSVGIELFVLDDGWFGNRTDDTKGLGDWTVNTNRLKGGLEPLINKINGIGLDFGIWVEPEMVNPNSNLYKAHPDWAITHPDYTPCLCRNQLVLDFSNQLVCQYIIDAMSKIFATKGLSYVKWDFNRPLTDWYSPTLIGRQGEMLHRYMLGFYHVLETLTTKFPHILFESCASGGNRVDLGILNYMPQFWASDNTDNFDRVRIQEGTLTCYPQSTMGCHVSASPNHQTLRTSSIDSRFNTACLGAFGYELDLCQLNAMDKNRIKSQLKWYKQYRTTLQFGTYYKTNSIFCDNKYGWVVVNADKTQAVANVTNGIAQTIPSQEYLVVRGLDDTQMYTIETRQQVYSIKQFGSLVNMVSPVEIKEEGKLQNFLEDNIPLLKSEHQKYTIGGDVLNRAGMSLCLQWGSTGLDSSVRVMGDFGSRLYGIDIVK